MSPKNIWWYKRYQNVRKYLWHMIYDHLPPIGCSATILWETPWSTTDKTVPSTGESSWFSDKPISIGEIAHLFPIVQDIPIILATSHIEKQKKKKLSKKLSNRKSRWSSPWPHIKSPYVHTIFIILKVLKSPWLKHQIPINPPYHYSTLVSGASSPLLGFCTSMDELVDHLKLLIEWMIH